MGLLQFTLAILAIVLVIRYSRRESFAAFDAQMQARAASLLALVYMPDTNLGAAIAGVKKTIAGLHLPSSIRVEYGGTYQTQQSSFSSLMVVLFIGLILVFLLLLFEFKNLSAPALILSSALLFTAGVFLVLLISGTTFNISSFMGLIMVIGIVSKNGILLIDADH